LANARERFHYLSHGLGAILIFVGGKMAISHWYHLNTYVSLAIILILLIGAVAFSEIRARRMGITWEDVTHGH
jgi:tellurite resistance protein TerC